MRRNSKGSALLTALLITAICAILATAILVNQSVIINQAELVHNADQMYLAASAANTWSLGQIVDHAISPDHGRSLYSNQSTMPIPAMNVGGSEVSGNIIDANSRFNINSLAQTKNQPAFTKLILAVSPDTPPKTANLIAQSVSNWLMPTGHDEDYLKHKPPYRPGHIPMVNLTELKAVLMLNTSSPAFSTDLYNRLLPMLVALPNQYNKININGLQTAVEAAPLLYALGQKLSLDNAKTLASCIIASRPYQNTTELSSRCPESAQLNSGSLDVKSQYYLVNSAARLDHQQLQMSSLIGVLRNSKNKPYFHIIWQALM